MNDADKPVPRDRGRWVKGYGNPDRRWQKGESISPGGRYGSLVLQRTLEGRGGELALRRLFRSKSVVVVHALIRVILDPKSPAPVKVAAAELFLERGWGKIEADDAAPKRAKKKDAPIVVVRRTPRSPYNSGGV